MPYPNKPLAEMTPDEIAQLSPEDFKQLADSHNDRLELNEAARNREIGELDPMMTDDFLNGPDNPLNYYDVRADLQWNNRRLSADQRDQLANNGKAPLTFQQQRDILLTLGPDAVKALADREKEHGNVADPDYRADMFDSLAGHPEIENHDADVDALLESQRKPLIPAVVAALKVMPGMMRESAALDRGGIREGDLAQDGPQRQIDPLPRGDDRDVDALLNKLVEDRIEKHSGLLDKMQKGDTHLEHAKAQAVTERLADQEQHKEQFEKAADLAGATRYIPVVNLITDIRRLNIADQGIARGFMEVDADMNIETTPPAVGELADNRPAEKLLTSTPARKYVYEEDLEHDHSRDRW